MRDRSSRGGRLAPRIARMAGLLPPAALALFLGLPASNRAEEASGGGYLSAPDLFKLGEESERKYVFLLLADLEGAGPEEIAARFWPGTAGALEFPRVLTDGEGGKGLIEYSLEKGCTDLLRKGEPFFEKKQYDKAAKFFARAVRKYPDCYVAHSHVGDCLYFGGDAAAAIEWYDRSIALNPHDTRGHFYRANALLKLGRIEEAREAYVTALALSPHRVSLVTVLRARSQDLGADFVDRPFLPRAFARQEEGRIAIYAAPGAPHWMVYGLCKAIWIGEPGHRRERTGKEEHSWTSTEERDCILAMLENYQALKENQEVETDPEMERLMEVLETGTLDGFVFYEIAYRIHPHMMLLLPDAFLEEVIGYVRRHVLVERPSPPAPPGGD